METLVEQARRLSSGTIASLTGQTKYVEIDKIRADFTAWCEGQPYQKWQDAWEHYNAKRCCREPKVRGGRCVNCGEWLDDE